MAALSPEKRLEKLDAERANLIHQIAQRKANGKRPQTGVQPRMYQVVREHLMEQKGQMCTVESLETDLMEKGHDLGRYPKRTIAVCLASPHTAAIFSVFDRKGVRMVKLAEKLAYTSPRNRPQQTARGARAN